MRGYLKLARIGNVIITFLSVECSGIICRINVAHSWKILAAAIAASLVTAGGNAINDVYDIDIDRINRPDRPLISGSISLRRARMFYVIVTLSGLLISALINMYTLLIAVIASICIFFYSYRLKRSVFFGNFAVGLMTGLAFIYGGSALDNFKDVYPAAVFAFLTNLIREIVKDAEDVKGDREIGIRTIATRYGTTASARVSIALTVILLVMVWGAFQVKLLPIQFLTVCGLTVFPIGIYITYLLGSRQAFSEASFGYKVMMVFGLIALIVGRA